MIWACPACRRSLESRESELCCDGCEARYPSVDGIPDLRLPAETWIDFEEDNARARRLVEDTRDLPIEAMVRAVFEAQSPGDARRVAIRTRQVLEGPERLRRQIDGWLGPVVRKEGRFLDLGCGAGSLLAAATDRTPASRDGDRTRIGIDVSMTWLVVARRLVREWGGTPILAAALADALPLPDRVVSGVVSLDVIEHVGDPRRYLREVNRVLAPGGHIAISTPNRYSLAAEPHVFVWGVGWMPRSLQQPYVRWRSGKEYAFVRLLGHRELRRLFIEETDLRVRILTPTIPDEEIGGFPRYRRLLASLYNRLVSIRALRWVFLEVGSFFRVVGERI